MKNVDDYGHIMDVFDDASRCGSPQHRADVESARAKFNAIFKRMLDAEFDVKTEKPPPR